MIDKLANEKTLLIVGAPRSGTNLLRDLITSVPGMCTWDCDELNLMWNYGNYDKGHDQLTKSDLSHQISEYIRDRFRSFGLKNSPECKFIVEKTCANALRLDFVDAILPDAHYVFIYRSPIDVVKSANLRWNGVFELNKIKYTLKKVLHAPISGLMYLAMTRMKSTVTNVIGKDKHVKHWGPRWKNYDEDLKKLTVEQMAIKQWALCTLAMLRFRLNLDPEKCIDIFYEDLTQAPNEKISKLFEFLGLEIRDADIFRLCEQIKTPKREICKVLKVDDASTLTIVNEVFTQLEKIKKLPKSYTDIEIKGP